MHEIGALVAGAIISVMLGANAALADIVGPFFALVVINVSGLIAVICVMLAGRRTLVFGGGLHWVFYLAGVSGVVLTFLNNVTVGAIGVTLSLALGSVGQFFASALIDHYGLLGVDRRPFQARKLAGFLLVAAGVVVMSAGKGA
jgi:transporter family-2 protein